MEYLATFPQVAMGGQQAAWQKLQNFPPAMDGITCILTNGSLASKCSKSDPPLAGGKLLPSGLLF